MKNMNSGGISKLTVHIGPPRPNPLLGLDLRWTGSIFAGPVHVGPKWCKIEELPH